MLDLLHVLARYGLRYKALFALVVVALLVENAYGFAVVLSFRFLIDQAAATELDPLLTILFGGLVLGLVVASAAGLGRDYVYARLGARMLNDIRLDLYDHLTRLSFDYFAGARLGDIVARFSSDVLALENAIVYSLPYFAFN